MPFIAIAIAAMLALGGGASIAANSSLPGDALYNLKIGVNEKIGTALSFSDEARAEAHLEDIAKRHDEAKKLEAQGKLTNETEAELNANIEAHAEAFATALANVKAHGSAEAVAQLQTKLQAALDDAAGTPASADSGANAHANATANVHSNAQGSATGTMNSASTSGQGNGKIEVNGGVRVGL